MPIIKGVNRDFGEKVSEFLQRTDAITYCDGTNSTITLVHRPMGGLIGLTEIGRYNQSHHKTIDWNDCDESVKAALKDRFRVCSPPADCAPCPPSVPPQIAQHPEVSTSPRLLSAASEAPSPAVRALAPSQAYPLDSITDDPYTTPTPQIKSPIPFYDIELMVTFVSGMENGYIQTANNTNFARGTIKQYSNNLFSFAEYLAKHPHLPTLAEIGNSYNDFDTHLLISAWELVTPARRSAISAFFRWYRGTHSTRLENA